MVGSPRKTLKNQTEFSVGTVAIFLGATYLKHNPLNLNGVFCGFPRFAFLEARESHCLGLISRRVQSARD